MQDLLHVGDSSSRVAEVRLSLARLGLLDGYEGEIDSTRRFTESEMLFDDTLAALNAVAYQPFVAPLEGTEHADLVGPLWLRDATLNIIGKGDGIFSPGKDAWAGWVLTSDSNNTAELQLRERIEPDAVVISRAVSEPF